MTWLIPRSHLTPEQLRAVEAPRDGHRLVVGPPGSGKTLVVVHRAASLAQAHRIPPSGYRILVFTNVLKAYIRTGCALLGIPDECVATFDHWARLYFQANVRHQMPWDATARRIDFDAVRRGVLDHVRRRDAPLYDFVVVDEGQDLDEDAFEILTRIARQVTVCADYKQQIYEHGTSEERIAAKLGLPRRNLSLLGAYRCSPYLVPLAAAFIADAEERRIFVNQTRTHAGARETPVLFRAPDFDTERARLAEIARSRQLRGDTVGILLPQKRQVHGFAAGLREFGLDVEFQDGRDGAAPDFASAKPKLLTYHSAKGLTFDSVLLPRLVTGSFARVAPELLDRLLFVGITRARNWVYLSAVDAAALPVLDQLQALAQDGNVQIRRTDAPTPPARPVAACAQPLLDDLL